MQARGAQEPQINEVDREREADTSAIHTYCFPHFLSVFDRCFRQERVTSSLKNRNEHKQVMAQALTRTRFLPIRPWKSLESLMLTKAAFI